MAPKGEANYKVLLKAVYQTTKVYPRKGSLLQFVVLCQVHAGPGGHVRFPTLYYLFLPLEVRLPSLSYRSHLGHCHRDGHQPTRIQRLGSRAGQSCLSVCLCCFGVKEVFKCFTQGKEAKTRHENC